MRRVTVTPLRTRRAVIARIGLGVLAAACGGGFGAEVRGQAPGPPGRIAFVRQGDIWLWHNGQASRLIKDGAASAPRWSPTGRFLLFVRAGDSYSDLILRDLETGAEQQLTHDQAEAPPGSPDYVAGSAWAIDPDWAASGLIAFASDQTTNNTFVLWLITDPALPPVVAPAAQSEDDIAGVSLSADGTQAAYAVLVRHPGANHTYVAVRNLADGTAVVLADAPGNTFDPAIAPGGGQVALVIRAADGTSDVWLVERATGRRTRVTTGAQATHPAWSPDGKWLAYLRMVDFAFEVWAAPLDGAAVGTPQQLFRFKNLDATSRISWTLSTAS
jgi:Tol biopolymer transport system component